MTEQNKSGFAALIGRPNVGKSTLMNYLIGCKIAITSDKPQTTRNRIQTVLTEERGQIIFVDTPGMHKAKNKLGEYMVKTASGALQDVDVVLWLVEASEFIGKTDEEIAQRLKNVKVPVVLVINKIDTVEREAVFGIINKWKDVMDFADIVPVSAQKGTNAGDLLDVVFKYLPYGPNYYDPDTLTDQPERAIVAELIREKALRCLNDEVPHGIAVAIDKMTYSGNGKKRICFIDATIVCERDSHKGIIIGKGGVMLKKIGSAARYETEKLLDTRVNLNLWVKVKKDWRDSDFLVKNYGYTEE